MEFAYHTTLCAVLVLAPLTFAVLMFVSAPYGKQQRSGWGPAVGARLGWVLWELPALVVFTWTFVTGPHALDPAPMILCALWIAHYVYRSLVYPFTLRTRPGADSKLLLVVLAMSFNGANGFTNGAWLSHFATPIYQLRWLYSPPFIAGIALFVAGAWINHSSDATLRKLRKPGETGYRIPYGGLFRWVSCPNYLGELLQWAGFALAGVSPAGLAFLLFTTANLVPRAIHNHRWYREHFDNYPSQRRAIIPGVI